MRRREVVALLATRRLAFAQQRTKLARLGFLGPAPAANFAPRVDALRDGLRQLGYTEGKSVSFEFRWWEAPDQVPELAAELVRAEVLIAPPRRRRSAF